MKITPIKNPGGIPEGCAETVPGMTPCPVCKRQMCIDVAKFGDSPDTAQFIDHEKLGGGYCPGSYINAKKLQAMTEAIQAIQDPGFVIADIINFDPAGGVQRLIAYLPDKACCIVADFKDGKFIFVGTEGQLQMRTSVDSDGFVDKWSDHNFRMTCWGTNINEKYLNIREQGKFFWDNLSLIGFDKWIRKMNKFLKIHREDLSKQFYCDSVLCYFARHYSCGDEADSYDAEIASIINQNVADRFPAGMFSFNTKLITEVR